MSLVMIVESFSLLIPVGIKKGGINIKEHEFRLIDGIDHLTQFTDDLVYNLHQVRTIFMNAKCGSIIGFEQTVDECDRTDLKQEFFEKEKSSIGGQIASIKIYF